MRFSAEHAQVPTPVERTAVGGGTQAPWHLSASWTASMILPSLRRLAAERVRVAHLVLSAALVGLVTAIGEASVPYVRPTHLALMYLLAVLIASIRLGLWPALFGAVLSVAALDYLFLPPLYSFAVNTPQDALLLAFLSVGAIIASGLASRLREQVVIAEHNAETTAALCQFAGKLAGTVTLEAAIDTVVDQVEAMLSRRAAISLISELQPEAPLTLPLRSSGDDIGLLTLSADDAEMTDEQRRLLEAVAELAGIAIGRHMLADRIAQLGIEQAADRLRSALLNSIAHDLTAPIGSVATALASLAGNYDEFDDATRRDLITEAERQAEHLHQFSANLVHMTRLEAGVVDLQREPIDIVDLVGSALVRAHHVLGPREVVVDIAAGLPRPRIDAVLMEQAIFHVLENAGKYTPLGSTVTITAEPVEHAIALKIADDGPGFPAEDNDRIFTKFYRASNATQCSGTGLGLAICRGFIEAHGGTIAAANRPDRGGALFTIVLPVEADHAEHDTATGEASS
jgi:two-component system sensor histidine kinase KdpD